MQEQFGGRGWEPVQFSRSVLCFVFGIILSVRAVYLRYLSPPYLLYYQYGCKCRRYPRCEWGRVPCCRHHFCISSAAVAFVGPITLHPSNSPLGHWQTPFDVRTHAPRHDALGLRWPINVPGDPIQSWLGVSSFMHRFGTLQYTTTTPTDRCISVTRYVIEGPEADSDLMLDGWTGTVRYATADRCVVVISRSDFVIANQPSSSHRGLLVRAS